MAKKFLQNVIAYSGVHFICQGLLFGQNLIVRSLLAPHILGIWNYVGVVQGFVNTFDLGINAAAIRELPLLRGRGELEEEARARATACWSSLAQGLIFMVAVLIYLIWGWQTISHKSALLVAAVLIVLSPLRDALITYHQGAQLYLPLSQIMLTTGILQVSLVCLGTFVGGLTGLMAAAVLVSVLQIVLMFHSCNARGLTIKRHWEWPLFKRQIGFGVPLRLVDYPMTLFSMLDILFITKFMSVGALAIYTTARLILAAPLEILSRMGFVIITRLNELGATETGKRQVALELRQLLFFEYLVLLPLIICLATFAGGLLVAKLIPKYVLAIPLIKILLLTMYFVPQTTLVRNFWTLDKRLFSLGVSNLVGLAGFLVLLYVTVNTQGQTLEAVAWATLGAWLIYYLYIMGSVGCEVWGKAPSFRLSLAALGSAAYTMFILSTLPFDASQTNFLPALIITVEKIALALFFLSPLFLLGGVIALTNKNLPISDSITPLIHKIKKIFIKK